MATRPNILLLCPSDPDDQSTGGAQRSGFLHRALSRIGEVYTLIPVPLKSLETTDANRRVLRRCVEQRRTLGGMLDWLAGRYFQVFSFPSLRRDAVSRSWGGITFDCVVVRYTHWAAYFRAWELAPLFLDIDDLPVECYRTLHAQPGGSWLRRNYDAVYERAVAFWSGRIFEKCAGVWLANREHMRQVGHRNAGWLPNLPREPQQEPSALDAQGRYIMSVGLMWYIANRQGVGRFIRNVWPVIRKAHPDLEYRVAGRDLPEAERRAWEGVDGVRIMGYVEDIEAFYRSALFAVAPIDAGSGTCIKVMEALRLGRVCLATKFAARGLAGLVGEEDGLLIADSDEELAARALWLLEHPAERLRLQARTTARIKAVCSFEAFAESVRCVLTKGLGAAG